MRAWLAMLKFEWHAWWCWYCDESPFYCLRGRELLEKAHREYCG